MQVGFWKKWMQVGFWKKWLGTNTMVSEFVQAYRLSALSDRSSQKSPGGLKTNT